ncbi:hypothetical protein [Actinomadura vinacea]|uniref:hypothetical protein n=1 Tax=Actinomadura vinacea TaxID=115336 RepID=UPI0031D15B0D
MNRITARFAVALAGRSGQAIGGTVKWPVGHAPAVVLCPRAGDPAHQPDPSSLRNG